MPRLRLLLPLVLLASWSLPAFAQFQAKEPNLKIGLNRVIVAGATYTLDDGTTALTNSDNLVGNELFAEYIFFGRLGVELGATLTPLARTYDLESGNTLVSTVTETTTSALLGANLYFGRNRARGFNFFFGLGTGYYSTAHAFKGGTLGEQSSSQQVPVNMLKFGMDWMLEQAGLRFQYAMLSGKLSDTEAIPSNTQTLDYTASVLTVGVLAFF
ncbi:MAG: hypothetical protein HY423_01970 [Candidatus Lambdaproteobacteria bacterium]|nr:hypothetical protein [Candidatus Lambdaproteobacteria bacterium]